MEHVDRYMEAKGHLGSASLEILSALSNSPTGALRMSDLARSVVMSPSGLTRHADRLVQMGLLDRVACAKDRRSIYAAISAEGKKALKKALPHYKEAVQEFFLRPLACADIGAMDVALAKIRVHFQGCPNVVEE